MRRRLFGSTGQMVPVIGQGTWDTEQTWAASVRAIRRGLDLGMAHIDTAEMYGRGRVEDLVGEAMIGRRDEVFLVSKVLPANATERGTIEACEASLRHLNTDHLDVYLLHSPSRHPFVDTLGGFRALQAAGKIRWFGVSNFSAAQLEAAVEAAGPGAIACNQVQYHLLDRAIESGVLTACERHQVALVGYSPFGQGNFPEGDPVLAQIAAARRATSRQVALAFLVRRPSLFSIPKSSSAAHVEENAGGDLELSAEEIAGIDAALPVGGRVGGPVPSR